jgi:hypothetical protein
MSGRSITLTFVRVSRRSVDWAKGFAAAYVCSGKEDNFIPVGRARRR